MAIFTYEPETYPFWGSSGGTVFSAGRSGYSGRAKAMAVQPTTNRRNARRIAVNLVAGQWRNALSPAQISDWKALAANTTFIDPVGKPYRPSGFDLFLRLNSILSFYDFPFQNTPTASVVAPAFNLVFQWDALEQQLFVVSGASMSDSDLLFFDVSGPLKPTVNYSRNAFVSNDQTSANVAKSRHPLLPAGTFSTGDRVSVRVRSSTSQLDVSDPQYYLFDCLEDLMFTLQFQLGSGSIIEAHQTHWLKSGEVLCNQHAVEFTAGYPLPFPCRLRHIGISLTTGTLVGDTPHVTFQVFKSHVQIFGSWLGGTTVSDAITFNTIVDRTSLFFDRNDIVGVNVGADILAPDEIPFSDVVAALYFEQGDFS